MASLPLCRSHVRPIFPWYPAAMRVKLIKLGEVWEFKNIGIPRFIESFGTCAV